MVPDTLSLPGGAAIWTSRINVTVGITIKGQTTITGAGTSSPIIADNTVILDNSPLNNQHSGLIRTSLSPTQSCRITGLTFRYGVRTRMNENGVVWLTSNGASPNYTSRVDHCHFDGVYDRNIHVGGWCYAVADNNVLDARGQGFYVTHAGYGGTNANAFADPSWSDFPYFGTNKFAFFETNTVRGLSATGNEGGVDAEFGARLVVRYNDFTNAPVGWHGTEGRSRGTRAVEVYGNHSHFSFARLLRNSGLAIACITTIPSMVFAVMIIVCCILLCFERSAQAVSMEACSGAPMAQVRGIGMIRKVMGLMWKGTLLICLLRALLQEIPPAGHLRIQLQTGHRTSG